MRVRNTRRYVCLNTLFRIVAQSSAVLAVFFVSTFSSGAQAATPLAPEEVKTSLLRGTDAQRTELSKALHLVIPKRFREGATADIPCTEFDSVEVSHAKLLRHTSNVVIKAFSSSCQYTYLIVLGQNKSAAWRYVQTVPIWSKNKAPRVTFESLINPDENEIIVQNYETDYGSGISQTNMTIWKLFSSGLQVVFDEPSRVTFEVPIDGKGSANTDQSEDNEFTFENSDTSRGENTGRKQILQKQVIRDQQTTITRWWRYSWVPEMKRFQQQPMWR